MSSSSSPPAVNATAAASARIAQAETEVRANCAALLALIDESRSWKVLEDAKGLRIVHKEVRAERGEGRRREGGRETDGWARLQHRSTDQFG